MINTLLTTLPNEAARIICRGGIVAFPTETVYGLGADIFDSVAVARIFEAKMRPNDNPLIAHIGRLEQIKSIARDVTPAAQKFIDAFFPAALTLVLPKSADVPLVATANLDTIGVRMPRNELAREFLQFCGTPVVAPSANLSGKPSPTTWEAVYEDLNGRIDCILQGEATEIGLESTVVDCTGETPLVLRTGAVSLEELQKVVPKTRRYFGSDGETVRSPGLKYRHYSPKARVVLVTAEDMPNLAEKYSKSAFIGVTKTNNEFKLFRNCDSKEQYAHDVFAFFRECDHAGVETIYCETVQETGIGAALMDRLRRAANV